MKLKGKPLVLLMLILLLFIALCISCVITYYFPSYLSISEANSENGYEVIRVVDGDTIIVDIDGNETRVRMIGIDTPESVHDDESRNCEFGKTVSEYTTHLLEGEYVDLEYDVERNDQYGRALAYVYLDDIMVNEALVEKGYAVAKEYPPNTKYAEEFSNAQTKAELDGVGMWNDSVSNQQTGGLKEKYALEIAA